MPKQKAPKGAAAAAEITDSRFSNFTTDPRFRLPSKKHSKTKLDSRFSRMLKDDDFSKSARVDRYGRKLNSDSKKKALERLYVPEDEDEDEEEADIEVEDDDVVEKELQRAETYDPARGGGFSSSDDEDEDEEDGGVEIVEVEEEFPDMQAQTAAVEMGEVSSRFAVVNLDWDYIRSVDLMAVFQSFVPPGGRIHRVSIFPSEFGKERMEREELEGPPKEIFAKKDEVDEEEEEEEEDESEDEDELEEKIKKDLQKADDGQDFDGAALRQYQLERLRYYYAVVVCSDIDTAQKIYEATDGTEYLSSANFFDLRFIPDGVEFDDKPRDECDGTPAGYRPTEFVTDALQHSKVKLTWDTNPEEAVRKDAIKRAFSGSRAEIGENDLRAYLGSDSEDDEEEEEAAEVDEPKLSKKELARLKMRAALGLTDESTKSSKKSSGPVGDMEITFTAGLSTKEKGGVFENEPDTETTAERYIRLEKERKARRKERAKAKREGRDPDADAEKADEAGEKDLGFDDPFFATDEAVKEKASKSQRKEDRLKKRAAKAAEAAEKASNRAELELLMADNDTEPAAHLDHFDINEIARMEKAKKKKGKKGKDIETGKRGGLQEGFEMDVGDSRFSKLFESHEFAIDPSNPKFKGTEGMKKLLEEGRKKRGVEGDDEVVEGAGKKRKMAGGESKKGELSGLVEKVKKKAKR
ncbi:hypothetical protein EG329_004112 [Mollisiaceae sp. DMI_Dod_QoI]|nr:hypothetical protein EG329_004112 [Helotiales sp. DMI_Dod_QoI]